MWNAGWRFETGVALEEGFRQPVLQLPFRHETVHYSGDATEEAAITCLALLKNCLLLAHHWHCSIGKVLLSEPPVGLTGFRPCCE